MKDIRDAAFVAKASDGTLVRRPLSPHIGIYRWPPTMLASILNRATGIALCAGMLLLVGWLAAAAAGPESFGRLQEFLAGPIGLFMLLGWTVSLFYHLFGGLRHLLWDAGYGFAKSSLNSVTFVVFGLSLAATALVWVVAYSRLGG